MSKIHPKGIVKHAEGPTYTTNDPTKFNNHGKFSGKTMSNKTVVPQATGPTFTANKAAVPEMSASSRGVGKSMGQKPAPQFNDFKSSSNLVSQRVASGGSGPGYVLKKSYAK